MYIQRKLHATLQKSMWLHCMHQAHTIKFIPPNDRASTIARRSSVSQCVCCTLVGDRSLHKSLGLQETEHAIS